MPDDMEVDDEPKTKGKKEVKDSGKARFEVKKVNALFRIVKRQEFWPIYWIIVECCVSLGVGWGLLADYRGRALILNDCQTSLSTTVPSVEIISWICVCFFTHALVDQISLKCWYILHQALIAKPTRLWLLARSATQHGGYAMYGFLWSPNWCFFDSSSIACFSLPLYL